MAIQPNQASNIADTPANDARTGTLLDTRAVNPAFIAKPDGPIKVRVSDLNVYYGSNHAIKNVSLNIPEKQRWASPAASSSGSALPARSPSRQRCC